VKRGTETTGALFHRARLPEGERADQSHYERAAHHATPP
jgi:hypothetical protein